MSLMVYDYWDEKKGKIPQEVILANDVFFDINTLLTDSVEVKKILHLVDNASYLDKDSFIDRFGMRVRRECLSSGCKVALNILLHPDKCFSTIECGTNALYASLVPQRGNVLWWGGADYSGDYNFNCNLMYKGKHFTKVEDFILFGDGVRKNGEVED